MPYLFQLLKPESKTVSASLHHVYSLPGVVSWTEINATVFKGAKVAKFFMDLSCSLKTNKQNLNLLVP